MKTGRPQKPDEEKKKHSILLRMTNMENQMLLDCSKKLKASKTEVMMTGLQMVYDDLKNGNEDC